jgi:hypothetical protein
VRPTTTRERSRRYQRQANSLQRQANNILEEQLSALNNMTQQQQFLQTPTDARPRGECPYCKELMVVGASTCPHCRTTGITWHSPVQPAPIEQSAPSKQSAPSSRSYRPYRHYVQQQVNPVRRQHQLSPEAAAGLEVCELRNQISKVALRREKMRRRLRGSTEIASCAVCNEKLPSNEAECFNCQYRELRKRIDQLTNKL